MDFNSRYYNHLSHETSVTWSNKEKGNQTGCFIRMRRTVHYVADRSWQVSVGCRKRERAPHQTIKTLSTSPSEADAYWMHTHSHFLDEGKQALSGGIVTLVTAVCSDSHFNEIRREGGWVSATFLPLSRPSSIRGQKQMSASKKTWQPRRKWMEGEHGGDTTKEHAPENNTMIKQRGDKRRTGYVWLTKGKQRCTGLMGWKGKWE